MENIIVLGAGLAGLGFARVHKNVKIFEAENHPGGHAYSRCKHGAYFDEGIHVSHSKDDDFVSLINRKAGQVGEVQRSKVVNYWHGEWISYPVQNHLYELPLDVRRHAVKDFVNAQIQRRPNPDKNYLEWCLSQYGEYMTDKFYAEYTAKYWRTPMEELATDWLSGRLLPTQLERILNGIFEELPEEQSTFTSFRYPRSGGFFGFFQPMYKDLNVSYNMKVISVDAKNRVINFENGKQENYEFLASSIPLPSLVKMVKDAPTTILDAANKLMHTQLLCVDMIIRRPLDKNVHWYYIYDHDFEMSRIDLMSNLVPSGIPADHTAAQIEIFRRNDEPMNIASLTEKSITDVCQIFNIQKSDILYVDPTHTPYSYVISDLQRAKTVDYLKEWLKTKGIYTMGLFGNWKYIWSDAAFYSGAACANNINNVMN